MRKVFAAVAALGLIGCAGVREARVEESRAEQQAQHSVVLASATSNAKAKKAQDGTGGSGTVDEFLIAPMAANDRRVWALDGEKEPEKTPEKKSEAKARPARRVLQPGAVQAEPAE